MSLNNKCFVIVNKDVGKTVVANKKQIGEVYFKFDNILH